MTVLILLLAVGVGMLAGDCKEFFFRDGLNNEMAYILFKIMFTLVFCEVNAFLLYLNFYLQKYEKAFTSIQQSKEKSKEKIKIENHTHETLFLPLEKTKEKEEGEEYVDPDYIPEPVKPAKSRGRSTKKILNK